MTRLGTFCVIMLSTAGPTFAFPDSPPPTIPKDLLEKRVEAARKVYEQKKTRLQSGQGLPAELFDWSERWLDAELALRDKKDERVKALRDHLDRTRELERMMQASARAGLGVQADVEAATFFRLGAEIRLVKEGVKPHPAKERKEKDGER
jgi:hypothetical protein